MATYEIIQPDVAGSTYNISDGSICHHIALDGIGLPQIERITQANPNIDGAFDEGFTIKPRELTLRLYFAASTKAALDGIRDQIYEVFKPFDDPLKLRVTRDDGSVRQIDVHTIGVLDLPESQRTAEFDQLFVVRLLAPYPFWYHPTQQVTTFVPSVSGYTFNVNYNGSWWEWPIIKVYGYVTGFSMDITLSLPGGNQNYQFFFSPIPAGDVFTYDLRPGYKTIKNAAGVSQLGNLTENSYTALSNFRLWPTPYFSAGVNPIHGTFSAKDASHKIEVYYYNRFLGV
ncbi:MAG: hypothetical protein E6Q97_25420 [Desulfurellales bacterium]|nr:MAG: hypothetical protein E6Q97_25420 [Desulfurellales bacterium]